jgi:hypothetical protein
MVIRNRLSWLIKEVALSATFFCFYPKITNNSTETGKYGSNRSDEQSRDAGRKILKHELRSRRLAIIFTISTKSGELFIEIIIYTADCRAYIDSARFAPEHYAGKEHSSVHDPCLPYGGDAFKRLLLSVAEPF